MQDLEVKLILKPKSSIRKNDGEVQAREIVQAIYNLS